MEEWKITINGLCMNILVSTDLFAFCTYVQVVNFLVHSWIQNLESTSSVSFPLIEEGENTDQGVTKNVEFFRKGTRRSVDVHFHGFNKSVWGWVRSHFNPFANLRVRPLVNEGTL